MRADPRPFRFTPLLPFAGVLRAALLGGILAGNAGLSPAAEPAAASVENLKRHVSVLASDTLEGRQAASRGGKAASAFLISELQKLPLEPAGTAKYVQEFGQDYRNILAMLPGSDPARARELIILGAHYDHVGYGNSSNSNGPYGQIHNGADDNASGTAVVLELARLLSQQPNRPACPILFAFWDAEESGLNGSRYWLTSQRWPAKDIRLVINIDMVGRLRNDLVKVQAWRSQAGLRQRMSEANTVSHLKLEFVSNVTADSDHWPFYRQRIPTVHLDTDFHEDYHRPSDDADKVNYDGAARITTWLADFVNRTAVEPGPMPFRPETFEEVRRGVETVENRPPSPSRLGLIWDPGFAARGRIIISEVFPNTPAETAGLKRGDEILKFGPFGELTTEKLQQLVTTSPARIAMEINRDGNRLPISVELAGQPVKLGVTTRFDPAVPHAVNVTFVVPGSPAAFAGIVGGDWIYSVNGRSLENYDDWKTIVAALAGDVTLGVEHEGFVKQTSLNIYDFDSVGR